MSTGLPSDESGVRLADRDEMLDLQAETDRRVHPRHPAGELTWVNQIRLKYGPTLSLVDLSSSGLQVETDDLWLRPGSTVVVEIVGGATVSAVPSRVVRCQAFGLAPSIRYRGGLEFKRLLEFLDPSKCTTADSHDANPLQSHARLALALRRLDGPVPGEPRIVGPHAPTADRLTTPGAGAMVAALAMLDTPAGRREPFAREMSGLFSDVAEGIEQRESAQELSARIEQRLRRVIPARSIRVTDGSSPGRPQHGSDVISFDAPSATSPRIRRIVVEFAVNASPQEWQLQLLKTSGHLVALITEVEERRRPVAASSGVRPAAASGVVRPVAASSGVRPVAASSGVRPAAPSSGVRPAAASSGVRPAAPSGGVRPAAPAENDLKAGWSKVVVRYTDGSVLKGYCQDFHPPRGHFQVWPSPTAPAEARVLVSLGDLRAVFFVRNFAGNSKYQEDKTIECAVHGRKVAVRFLDGERLVGTTLNYRPDGVGFFVTPSDPKSNNIRIYALARAVLDVQFE